MANVEKEQKVLCFPRPVLGNADGLVSADDILRRMDRLKMFVDRHEAEASDNLVQLIGCAVITDEHGRYRAFETPPTSSYDRGGSMSLIVGGHTDMTEESDIALPAAVLAHRATRREIREELGRRPPEKLETLGLIVDASSHRNSRHVGLIHHCSLTGPVHPEISGEFIAESEVAGLYRPADLRDMTHLMDPWSRIAVEHIAKEIL
ncbi:MAG: hypothetical protein OXC95_17345 [Dehalococcoidia bacterium]|nr:hypothetical protein [Dehalococcoidia bacterium]